MFLCLHQGGQVEVFSVLSHGEDKGCCVPPPGRRRIICLSLPPGEKEDISLLPPWEGDCCVPHRGTTQSLPGGRNDRKRWERLGPGSDEREIC